MQLVDDQVGSKAQRVEGQAIQSFQRSYALQIDDVQAFGGHVGKAVTSCRYQTRRTPQLRRHIAGDEGLNRGAPGLGSQIALSHHVAVLGDRQGMAVIIKLGAQAGQLLVAHQHDEMQLWKVGWARRIKGPRTVFDGIGPVKGQRLPGFERCAFKLFTGQTFDGIAIDRR